MMVVVGLILIIVHPRKHQIVGVYEIPHADLLTRSLITFDHVYPVSPSVIVLVALNVDGLSSNTPISIMVQALLGSTVVVFFDSASVKFLPNFNGFL